jgi:hypothetical protein
MRRHPFQARHEPLQAVDFFAPYVDVIVGQFDALRAALEQRSEIINRVADFMGNFGRDGFDQSFTLSAPGFRLLPAPLLQLLVGLRMGQRKPPMIGNRTQ